MVTWGTSPSWRGTGWRAGVKSVVTQFTGQHGLVAIGMVAELQNELQSAFLRPERVAGVQVRRARGVTGASLVHVRERLHLRHGARGLVGGWGEGAAHPGAVRVPLSQCESPWNGDLVAVVREATMVFLAQSTLNRPDIKAVVEENDRKAGRPETLPTDDLYALPGYYEDIAPVTTNVREPMVATWRVEDLDGHTPYAEGASHEERRSTQER